MSTLLHQPTSWSVLGPMIGRVSGRSEVSEFRWTGQRVEASVLVAEDRLTNEEIATRVGVSRQSLDKWKRHPEFQRRVESLVAAMAEAVRARGIASRERRVDLLPGRGAGRDGDSSGEW